MPISTSHCTFCVTRPRLEVRLRNNAVDNSGSTPARSLARTEWKNPTRVKAPATSRPSISQRLLSAASTPDTTRTSPADDSTAPRTSNGRAGSGGRGSRTYLRLSTKITTITSAWNRNATRQLSVVVMSPPISGPVAAPMPAMPLIAPKARARAVTPVNSIVARM